MGPRQDEEFRGRQIDAVRTRDLTKRYGKIEALAGLDVRIPEGSLFGVLGPNGAGKSTLIRAVCGITKPTSGTVTVLGADATSERRRLRKRIGYMPQEPALYEDLSPLQNLRFFAGAYGIHDTERRISGVLDLLELTGRADSPVYGLSGGTKQRVSLGCALVHGPDLLLLDEPTAGMDPRLRKRFWEHFGALGREGKTIVVSTHQMDELAHCDRAAILQRGALLAAGAPHEILSLGETRVRVSTTEGAVLTRTFDDYETKLPGLLRDIGIERVASVEVEPASLDEVMLKLMGQGT